MTTIKQRTVIYTFLVSMCVALGSAPTPVQAADNASASAKEKLLRVCTTEGYAMTPRLREAFLAWARQQAMADLKADGVSLPREFTVWVDSDPDMATGVYGVHHEPKDVLLWLYSLRMDLGRVKFNKYRQLALAAAIVSAKEGMKADITPRAPLKLMITGDPRKPVDTKDPKREFDVYDHVINFLNEHTIEEDVAVGSKGKGKLKYDSRGIAIPDAGKKKSKTPQVTVKRTRSLYAADVLASRELQAKFNAYMKSKGHDVGIDCGEKIVHWNSRDMVRGEQYKKVNEAYQLFRKAYEAKGLLPDKRDPFPTPAERCAYLIRNHEYKFPPQLQAQRQWPRFPLTAPWPMLTMLAADRQPLREREERWVAFRDRGEFPKMGEYIGGIAQQHAMQSARRLTPHPFTYASIQMMLKDGGVCGTMGAISARMHNTLGIPASQATQPGHCAMVAFLYDAKTKTYQCKGDQYATGGDEKTGPFTPWPFEREFKRTGRRGGYEISFHRRKPMVYHQTLAWGVNFGFRSWLDATIAHGVFQVLPKEQRESDGMKLLESGLVMNPYQSLLVDTAQETATTSQEQIRFFRHFQTTLRRAAGKPGCPTDGLYNTTVKNNMFNRISRLRIPKDKKSVSEILSFLEAEKCTHAKTLENYRRALK